MKYLRIQTNEVPRILKSPTEPNCVQDGNPTAKQAGGARQAQGDQSGHVAQADHGGHVGHADHGHHVGHADHGRHRGHVELVD